MWICARGRSGLASRVQSTEHHDVLWVDAQGLGSLCIGQPGEFKDRAACGVQDQVLDLLGVAVDAVALPAEERDLRDRIHHSARDTPGWVGRVSADRIERSRRLAPEVSVIGIGFFA